jgi:hypothetical protein
VVQEPPEQLWLLQLAWGPPAEEPEPPGTQKLEELKILCRFADPHVSQIMSTFSSVLRNRISFFAPQSAHLNS